ncbi:hypothetical protein [Falsiphaeobacter marinintestinus]|uniref:hypothetical protein n=1 Tax=Falsiphaeobacter marinintestinus TaxID=1492905 RepID=UPI0011B4C4E4|nr:hypothetical protein [Phaeobacter marinintestinus]
MKPFTPLTALFFVASTAGAMACPWAGGTFEGNNNQVTVEFTVNADCTMVSFQSTGSAGFQPPDTPEDFAMVPGKYGWDSEMHGVTTTFQTKGKIVDFNGPGVTTRLHVDPK